MFLKKIEKAHQLFKRKILIFLLGLLIISPSLSFAQDPSGTKTGTLGDIDTNVVKALDTISKAKDTTVSTVSSRVSKLAASVQTIGDADGHNKIAINIMWTLITGFLVMFMQAGFALVETGFTQKKNVAHTMAMNFMVYGIGMIGFWICGFAFMFGGAINPGTLGGAAGVVPGYYSVHLFGHDFRLIGTVGYFLGSKVYDVGIFTLFLFQMVFMDTTATIPTGSMAERWSFKSFILFGFFISMFVYPIFGNWVWGGGWLSTLGTEFRIRAWTCRFCRIFSCT